MTETALGRALKRADIAAYVDAQLAQQALDADSLKGRAKIMAIHRGIDLMHNAQSEAVQARMVELFAGEDRKAPLVNVNIGATSKGYEYAPPGSQVVEIRTPPDSPSSADDKQALDKIDDAEIVQSNDDPTT